MRHLSNITIDSKIRACAGIIFDIHVAEDIFDEETSWHKTLTYNRYDLDPIPNCIVEHAINQLFYLSHARISGKTLRSLYSHLARTRSQRVGILWAHAGFKEGAWSYGENKKTVEPIQDWVDRVAVTPAGLRQCDQYGSLIIVGCNKERTELYSPLPHVRVYYPLGGLGFLHEFTIACTK